MKIKQTRESDFKEIEFEYADFQYELACKIKDEFGTDSSLVFGEGRKIFIHITDIDPKYTANQQDLGIGKYRITIEPVNEI